MIDYFFKVWDINAVTLLLAYWNVEGYLRTQSTQGLDEHSRGCLSIHVKIPPNTNLLVGSDDLLNPIGCGEQPGQVRRW
jgi:hypothetical protein